jgi:hypothetical protein
MRISWVLRRPLAVRDDPRAPEEVGHPCKPLGEGEGEELGAGYQEEIPIIGGCAESGAAGLAQEAAPAVLRHRVAEVPASDHGEAEAFMFGFPRGAPSSIECYVGRVETPAFAKGPVDVRFAAETLHVGSPI